MERYIALLRGINVSGQKIIKMEDLRGMFDAMSFKNVVTYIQSGNVLFDVRATDETVLHQKIEKYLAEALGYNVPVFIRTIAQLQSTIDKMPFKGSDIPAANQPYVSFMHEAPDNEKTTLLESFNCETDTFKVIGREVYSLQYKDKGKPVFTNMFIEKKLKQPATGRNWLTVNKLVGM